MQDQQRNILDQPLEPCSTDPVTGFHRSGDCRADVLDAGSHTVCARMTREFLDFTKGRGNDLSTPNPAFGFPGLKPGDRWCLCALRWLEAHEAGVAPPVYAAASNLAALRYVPLELLKASAIDIS